MKWFGENWGAPICEDLLHIETPVDKVCGFCNEPIREGDRGVVMPFHGGEDSEMAAHHRCFMKALGIGKSVP